MSAWNVCGVGHVFPPAKRRYQRTESSPEDFQPSNCANAHSSDIVASNSFWRRTCQNKIVAQGILPRYITPFFLVPTPTYPSSTGHQPKTHILRLLEDLLTLGEGVGLGAGGGYGKGRGAPGGVGGGKGGGRAEDEGSNSELHGWLVSFFSSRGWIGSVMDAGGVGAAERSGRCVCCISLQNCKFNMRQGWHHYPESSLKCCVRTPNPEKRPSRSLHSEIPFFIPTVSPCGE